MDCLVASWIVYDGVELTPAIASNDECDKQSNGNDVQDGHKSCARNTCCNRVKVIAGKVLRRLAILKKINILIPGISHSLSK